MLGFEGFIGDRVAQSKQKESMYEYPEFTNCMGVREPRASLVAQLVKNLPACRKPPFNSWVRKIPWRRDRLPTPVSLGFPGGSDGKESACNAGDLGSVPGLGRSLGGGNGYPLQYSCLENPHGQRSLEGYSPWGRRVRHD